MANIAGYVASHPLLKSGGVALTIRTRNVTSRALMSERCLAGNILDMRNGVSSVSMAKTFVP